MGFVKSFKFELELLYCIDGELNHEKLKKPFFYFFTFVYVFGVILWIYSSEEAGRYLETYKVYENKPPDALLGQSEGDYLSKLTDCLTTVKGINKTDVVSLSSTFGSLANMATASKDDLALLPGFGPLKAQRLHDLLQQPFVGKKDKSREVEAKS